MHSGDLLRSPLCITITLFYFSSRPLYLVDLAFERFDREIDRLLETFAPALGHQVVSRNMEVDRGDFISEFVVFIQFQYDVGSDSRSTKRSSLSILCSTNSTNFLSASNFTD